MQLFLLLAPTAVGSAADPPPVMTAELLSIASSVDPDASSAHPIRDMTASSLPSMPQTSDAVLVQVGVAVEKPWHLLQVTDPRAVSAWTSRDEMLANVGMGAETQFETDADTADALEVRPWWIGPELEAAERVAILHPTIALSLPRRAASLISHLEITMGVVLAGPGLLQPLHLDLPADTPIAVPLPGQDLTVRRRGHHVEFRYAPGGMVRIVCCHFLDSQGFSHAIVTPERVSGHRDGVRLASFYLPGVDLVGIDLDLFPPVVRYDARLTLESLPLAARARGRDLTSVTRMALAASHDGVVSTGTAMVPVGH